MVQIPTFFYSSLCPITNSWLNRFINHLEVRIISSTFDSCQNLIILIKVNFDLKWVLSISATKFLSILIEIFIEHGNVDSIIVRWALKILLRYKSSNVCQLAVGKSSIIIDVLLHLQLVHLFLIPDHVSMTISLLQILYYIIHLLVKWDFDLLLLALLLDLQYPL
jgi:hypothetical protein